MSLSPAFLDELRARTSLSGVIGRTTRLTKAGHEFKACCPFHNEKSPSFTVNDDKGFYHCFGCGAHGDAIRWLTDQRGLAFMDAVKELAGEAGLELPAMDPRAAEKAEQRQGLDEVMVAAQAWFVERLRSDEGAAARKYLAGRGFAPAVVERFGFGFAPEGRQAMKVGLKAYPEAMLIEGGLRIVVEEKEPYDRFRGRLMLPIRNPRGQIIGFGGRILDAAKTDAPKYLNSPDTPIFDKGRTLYNLDKAAPLARKSGRLVVVEGYMDVVALANAGIEEAVAPLGTALTEAQLELAWRVCETPVLCFDGDAAGQRAAMRAMIRALPLLRPSHSLAICRMPQGLDPDDLLKAQGPQALLDLLGKATPLVEALWQAERDAQPTNTPEEKAGLKARVLAHAETIGDPDIRGLYRKELLKKFSAFAFPARDWSAHKNVIDLNAARRFAATQTRIARPFSESAFTGGTSAELAAKHKNLAARRLHLHRRLGAAIAAGLIYYPSYSIIYAETLYQAEALDPRIEAIADATFDGDVLEPSRVMTILKAKGLTHPTPDEWDHLRFPFAWPPVDDSSAVEGLEMAIRLYVGLPQVKRALEQATNKLVLEFSEANWQEQQRLLKLVREFKIERRHLIALAA